MKTEYKIYELEGPMTQADLDWMYTSGIDIHIESPYKDGDSGWCDMDTGQEIVTPSHKFTAIIKNDEQDTWLKLYWENRAKFTVLIQETGYKYKDAN